MCTCHWFLYSILQTTSWVKPKRSLVLGMQPRATSPSCVHQRLLYGSEKAECPIIGQILSVFMLPVCVLRRTQSNRCNDCNIFLKNPTHTGIDTYAAGLYWFLLILNSFLLIFSLQIPDNLLVIAQDWRGQVPIIILLQPSPQRKKTWTGTHTHPSNSVIYSNTRQQPEGAFITCQ